MRKNSDIELIPTIKKSDIEMSSKWFESKIKEMSQLRITPAKLMGSHANIVKNILPGKMYFYYYDPKHKETLPYYDRFPLVMPFGKQKGSFTGLNLHYLHYQERIALLNELLKITGTRTLTDNKKLQLSWELINQAARQKHVAACVKMYLDDHVKSPFFEVPGKEWYTAMMLPVQRFVGASKEKVWSEQKRK